MEKPNAESSNQKAKKILDRKTQGIARTEKSSVSEKKEVDTNSIVIACGGLSLADTDWSYLPFPIAAINKAIWVVPRFEYWFIADGYPERYYKDKWLPIAQNPSIAKCVPKHRLSSGSAYRKLIAVGKNIHALPMSQGRHQDKEMLKRGRSYLDGRSPLFFIENKTTLFATQWLAMGFNRLIFVGCELTFTENIASCTGGCMTDGETRHMRKNLDMVKRGLEALEGAASKRGIEMLSFSPGRINDFMERYIPCTKSTT